MNIAAEESVYIYDGGYYKAEYVVKSSLSDRQFIEVRITNTGSDVIEGWALKYDACGVINNIWGGEIYKQEGTRCIIKNKGYNCDIQPGKSTAFGYTLTQMTDLSPDKFFICSKRIDKSYGYDASWKIAEETADDFSAEVTLSNLTQQLIEGWQLGFKGNFIVSEVSNAVLLNSEASNHKIAGNADTRVISADSSVTFNIIGSKTGELSIADFSLSEIIIDEDFSVLDDLIELMLFASGSYNAETNTITVEWYSTCTEGSFDILSSNDGENFSSIAMVYGTDTYTYSLKQQPEMLYIIVMQKVGSKTAESNIIQLIFDGADYIPFEPDADEDGVPDAYEEYYQTDPEKPDSDDDGLTDSEEITQLGTDPISADTDNNGTNDADEDFDNDGLTNQQELELGLDPYSADTDGDGLSDGDEINVHGTDPLEYDTDSDGIGDSDELKIGLDPKNPATFGVPDSEYTIEQAVSSDSEALSLINTEENPYKLSVEIKAAGYVEGGISASQSSYSNVMKNPAILGSCPELVYSADYKVDSVTIKFEVSDEYVSNEGSLFAQQSSEFEGIKRFNIFRYFEDINMLLPVETKFDIDKNILYTESNALGSYCVMDMEIWLESIGVTPEAEASDSEVEAWVETEQYLSSSPASEAVGYSNDTEMTHETIEKCYAGNNVSSLNGRNISDDEDDESGEASVNERYYFIKQTNQNSTENINLVFMIDTRCDAETLETIKESIREVSEKALAQSENISIYFMRQNHDKSAFSLMCSNCHSFNKNQTIEEKAKAVNTILDNFVVPEQTNEFKGCLLSDTIDFIHEKISPTGKTYCFSIFDSNNVLFRTSDADEILSTISAESEMNISVVSIINYADPGGYAIDQYVFTKGIHINSYAFAEEALKHIYGFVPNLEYNIISLTGWNVIKLSAPLVENSSTDTDKDGLTDWDEVDNETIENFRAFTEKDDLPTYASIQGLLGTDLLQGKYGVGQGFLEINMKFDSLELYREDLYTESVLPILSDPTSEDGDGDGYDDFDEVNWDWNGIDKRYETVNPLKSNTIQTFFPELYPCKGKNKTSNAVFIKIDGNHITYVVNYKLSGIANEQNIYYNSSDEAAKDIAGEKTNFDVAKKSIMDVWCGEFKGNLYDFYPGLNITVDIEFREAGFGDSYVEFYITDDIDECNMHSSQRWGFDGCS
jgi:hypothetical protein